jgi:putative SOS response-associated peptidase YedK
MELATGRCSPSPASTAQWKGPIKKDGDNVTTLPNALTSTINHERSPVLLTEEAQFATWLTGTPEQAMGLITTSDPESCASWNPGSRRKTYCRQHDHH